MIVLLSDCGQTRRKASLPAVFLLKAMLKSVVDHLDELTGHVSAIRRVEKSSSLLSRS
jgi:hypothetical protein